jgi:hypothetical protein
MNLQNTNQLINHLQKNNMPSMSNDRLVPEWKNGSNTARTRNEMQTIRLNQDSMSDMEKVMSPVMSRGQRQKSKGKR